MIDQAEFARLSAAIALAASIIPPVVVDDIEKVCQEIYGSIDRTARNLPDTLPEDDRQRFVAFIDLLRAAAKFKDAGDKMQRLGPLEGPLADAVFESLIADGGDFEEDLTPDPFIRIPVKKQ
jgi:hypothetical protein